MQALLIDTQALWAHAYIRTQASRTHSYLCAIVLFKVKGDLLFNFDIFNSTLRFLCSSFYRWAFKKKVSELERVDSIWEQGRQKAIHLSKTHFPRGEINFWFPRLKSSLSLSVCFCLFSKKCGQIITPPLPYGIFTPYKC